MGEIAEMKASLAQPVERSAVNRKVTGSIPVGSVFESLKFCVPKVLLIALILRCAPYRIMLRRLSLLGNNTDITDKKPKK